jgi:hypothetical protein
VAAAPQCSAAARPKNLNNPSPRPQVNKIRELPQHPEVLVTHTDAPELYVWNVDKQPNAVRGPVRGWRWCGGAKGSAGAAAAMAAAPVCCSVAPALALAHARPDRAAPAAPAQDKRWPQPAVAEAVLTGHTTPRNESLFALATST